MGEINMHKTINQSFSKSVLQYNNVNIEIINKICSPLKSCFGITSFGYGRIFNQGRYILLSNSPIYLESAACYDYTFNTKFFRNALPYISKYDLYKLVWLENTGDEFIERVYAQGICHGFNIAKENAGTFEYYFFGTDRDSPLIRDFYIEHFHALKDFIVYFHKVAESLIETSDTTKQGVFPYVRDTYPQIETVFARTTPWEENIIKFNALLNEKVQEEIYEIGKTNSLTFRELQCLSYFSAGKTAKEIARVLNIGPRTVETYIANIRLKTKLQTKSELIHWFEDTFRHFLIKTLPLSDQLLPTTGPKSNRSLG